MKKITYEKVDETFYYKKINNQIDTYFYQTNKTKNFYISISVKFGANVLTYKLGDKEYNVIPGTAHFLEHKLMSISSGRAMNIINKYGIVANAYTSWDLTNYNFYGSGNIEEALTLLLDLFYNFKIDKNSVEIEKGIISEEIDMGNDNIETMLYFKLFNNLHNNSYLNNTIAGKKEDIKKITTTSLKKAYKDFYIPQNTFITVCGNYDIESITNLLETYIKNLKLRNKIIPKIKKQREKHDVKTSLEIITKPAPCPKIKIGYKINKKIFNQKDNDLLCSILNIILMSNINIGTPLNEKYKNNNLIIDMEASSYIFDNYLIIVINALSKNPNDLIKELKKDIENMTLSEEIFERKKKLYLKNFILSFDDIVDVEDIIVSNILSKNKLKYKTYSEIINISYKDALDVMKKLYFNNESIIILNDEK